MVNSLNAGDAISVWEGISLRWYAVALHNEGFLNAATNPLILATTAAVVATLTATMAALATTLSRGFRGEGVINLVLNQPIPIGWQISPMSRRNGQVWNGTRTGPIPFHGSGAPRA